MTHFRGYRERKEREKKECRITGGRKRERGPDESGDKKNSNEKRRRMKESSNREMIR